MNIPVSWFGSAFDRVTLKEIPSLKGVLYAIPAGKSDRRRESRLTRLLSATGTSEQTKHFSNDITRLGRLGRGWRQNVWYDLTPIFDGDPFQKTHSEIFFHLWFDRPWGYDLK